jgi:hypothetical protein
LGFLVSKLVLLLLAAKHLKAPFFNPGTWHIQLLWLKLKGLPVFLNCVATETEAYKRSAYIHVALLSSCCPRRYRRTPQPNGGGGGGGGGGG